jgi:hypothetical protein
VSTDTTTGLLKGAAGEDSAVQDADERRAAVSTRQAAALGGLAFVIGWGAF